MTKTQRRRLALLRNKGPFCSCALMGVSYTPTADSPPRPIRQKSTSELQVQPPRLGLRRWAIVVLIFAAPSCVATDSRNVGEPNPPQFVIGAVPYVSWSDATRLEYPDKAIVNPSMAAALAMISQYWGHESITVLERWATIRAAEDASLRDIKAALRSDGPVLVTPALTPWAHPVPSSVLTLMQSGVVDTPRQLRDPPTSRLLGFFASFELFREFDWLPFDPLLESMLLAARVVIGYDDRRGVIILHDPSFGPLVERTYADFEKMWLPAGSRYVTVRPKDPNATPTAPASPPTKPSPEQRALQSWVYGYALASVSQIDEAAQEYRRGLELPGITAGLRHVLLLELALCQRQKGRNAAAIETARQAAALVPEHYVGWMLLGNLYAESSLEDRTSLARQYTSKAEDLKTNLEAVEIVAAALPQDIYMPYTRLKSYPEIWQQR